MAHKTKIGGTAYEIGSGKVLVDGTGYSIDKGRTKVDGTGYDISFGTQIGSLEVGTSVFMNYKGARTEFLIVHQGSPSSRYRNTDDGTWLLIKDIYDVAYWDDTNNDYKNSNIHNYLQNTCYENIDSNIRSAIKEIKIPYMDGTDSDGTLKYGANGLAVRLFLLSYREVSEPASSSFLEDGALLSYFNETTATSGEKRIAYRNGSAIVWWLRTPESDGDMAWMVYNNGGMGTGYADGTYYTYGVRFAFVLPKEIAVDSEFNVIA